MDKAADTVAQANLFGLSGLTLIVAVLALILVILLVFARRMAVRIIGIPQAAVLFVVGLFALVVWWPVSLLTDLVFLVIPLDRLMQAVLWIPAVNLGPLIAGQREEFAKWVWPPSIYPDLYRAVPADLIRPPIEDGRLIGGGSITWLADRYFTSSVYRSAFRASFKGGIITFLIAMLIMLATPIDRALEFAKDGYREVPTYETWPGEAPIKPKPEVFERSAFQLELNQAIRLIGNGGPYLAASAVFALGATFLMMLLILSAWQRDKAGPYRMLSKDADVRWPHRIETRALLRETYRRQVELATTRLAGQPTYKIGTATGTLRVRGDLSAPTPGQAMALDRESLFQHLLVFGGTGEGKTTALLKPIIREVLADSTFGAYVSDAKGVLWVDALGIANALGRADDVVVIGTGENAKGVNVVAGLTPSQVAATLRSVLSQISPTQGDSFWPDMAANMIRHMLTIGEGFAHTASGQRTIRDGLHPYSLWWAYQAILQKDILESAIKAIHKAFTELETITSGNAPLAEKRRALQQAELILSPEVRDSIAYIDSAWAEMADKTKSGVVASITQLLDGLSGSPVLRTRFASGRDEHTVSLRDALDGKIVLNSLSTIEDGLPARIISILIKTTLYREARKREAELKSASPPTSAQDAPCLVVMDEIQELATVDPTSGLSDATFWNVARSSGLAGVFATQTLAALEQSMGEAAAKNFVQQARSKIFFRTEEPATVDYACWAAGEYERNRVYEDHHFESIEYRQLISGWDPLAPVDAAAQVPAGPGVFFDAAKALLSAGTLSLEPLGRFEPHQADLRFVPGEQPAGENKWSNAAMLQGQQAAFWRQDDMIRQYRSQGNETEKALKPSDMLQMGRWHAYAHIQRAGASRQDIVVVAHDFS